jgi:hypothetical protein
MTQVNRSFLQELLRVMEHFFYKFPVLCFHSKGLAWLVANILTGVFKVFFLYSWTVGRGTRRFTPISLLYRWGRRLRIWRPFIWRHRNTWPCHAYFKVSSFSNRNSGHIFVQCAWGREREMSPFPTSVLNCSEPPACLQPDLSLLDTVKMKEPKDLSLFL